MIRIENLNKYFYKRHNNKKVEKQVLHNISFSIGKNESIGIIGNSGSGKTTIIKILFNLEKPDSGKIYFEDKNIFEAKGRDKAKLYKNMGLVMQDPYSSLCPYMKVKEIISEPIKIHNLEREIKDVDHYVSGILGKVHLEPNMYLEKYPSELSGGERQRVAIARSIVTKPRILVLDEPTSMIDADAKAGVLKLLSDLKEKENLSMIMISHDISTVLDSCDKVIVLKDGKIIEEKSAEEIRFKQEEEYTKELILASKDLKEYWKYLKCKVD